MKITIEGTLSKDCPEFGDDIQRFKKEIEKGVRIKLGLRPSPIDEVVIILTDE